MIVILIDKAYFVNTFFEFFVIIYLVVKLILQNIKGIGPKSLKLLNKIGINNVSDLVNYYPYRYNIFQMGTLDQANDQNIICGQIISTPIVNYIKRNFNRLSFNANIENKIVKVIIFNRAFMKPNLSIEKYVYLQGKYDEKKNTFTASNIFLNIPSSMIQPIYHLTNGLTNQALNKYINCALDVYQEKEELPNSLMEKYNFISQDEALKIIHNPVNIALLKKAKIKLIYKEFFDFTFKLNYLKLQNKNIKGQKKEYQDKLVDDFIKDLPFSLTEDQKSALFDIESDLKSPIKMNRLIIGDVGSGKTVLCIIAMYANYLAGYQSAFMAPTEILAQQHYNSINKLLAKFNITSEILVGSMTKKEKANIIKRLANNEIDIIIGTHTLIQENVLFNNLGLIITDEQHRFGVMQRKLLGEKGNNPDALYLSATPIPRTYALALYGDLDVSLIKTKPAGRKEIYTKVVDFKNLKKVLTAIYEELKNHHQIFVVSPLIEENESQDLESVQVLKDKFKKAFKSINIEVLHGKLTNEKKQSIMNDFKNGIINILISTTVVEVGVDISNATMMVIFNAERFGLATLHQLRGRVGRNDLNCSCYLISNYQTARLKVLEESNDGFYISQKDFELRKEGDIFGTKQSGTINFKIANLYSDGKILLQAKKDSEQFVLSKEYINNSYYCDIIKKINNLD